MSSWQDEVALVDCGADGNRLALRLPDDVPRRGWRFADSTMTLDLAVRPLAVIDPEDSRSFAIEAAQRACSALNLMPGRIISPAIQAIQEVIREFATPAPRIEEPTGLGAVVEDDQGCDWHRTATGRWLAEDGLRTRAGGWGHIKPVRILFPGSMASDSDD